MVSKAKMKKYLEVEKSHVFTKIPARIVIDLSEHRNIDDEYGENIGIEQVDNVYKMPGFFTLEFPEVNDSIDFFFPYTIYLNKTEDTIESKEKIEINFQEEDLVFYGNFKDSDTNISLLSSTFENGSKYLGNKPDKLLSSLWQQLQKVNNVNIQHLEIIVSQLYSDYDKTSKMLVPLRLTGKAYNKKYITNMKESSHNLGNAIGFTYGYSKDALRASVSKKKTGGNSFFEDILGSNYDALIEKSK